MTVIHLVSQMVVLLCCRIACFNLDEFEAAKAAFEAGQALEPSKATYKTWIRKCNAELEGRGFIRSTTSSINHVF